MHLIGLIGFGLLWFSSLFSIEGSLAAHQALRADPRLFKDDVDIRFSRTLNSCKLPQVRYATPERLLQRLTGKFNLYSFNSLRSLKTPLVFSDLRFLSIDFLNTFLLTYRVFTDGETVLNALKKVFYDPPDSEPPCDCEPQTGDLLDIPGAFDGRQSPRRTSAASSVSGYCSEGADRDRSMSNDSIGLRFKGSRRMLQQQSTQEEGLSWIPECGGPIIVHEEHQQEECEKDEQIEVTVTTTTCLEDGYLAPPNAVVVTSSSSDTLTGEEKEEKTKFLTSKQNQTENVGKKS